MFIEIKGLHASYGATPILHDINVSLLADVVGRTSM